MYYLHFYSTKIVNFLANLTIFYSVLSLSNSHQCPAILPGTMLFAEFSSAHKIDLLYNLPDIMHLPSLWSFRAQIGIARTFNEFIQPRCVLLSRWLSATESISGWALALVDIYLAWSNSQTSCKQTDYKANSSYKIQKKVHAHRWYKWRLYSRKTVTNSN